MSGADCQAGCTSCPTCRGEVRRDSPAMHDMSFAMAMNEQSGADPFWQAMAVAQSVREGMRARGATAVGDGPIMDFVNGLAQIAGRPFAAASWDAPSVFFDEQPAPPAAAPENGVIPLEPWTPSKPGPGRVPGEETPEQAKAGGYSPSWPHKPRMRGPSNKGRLPATRPGSGAGGGAGPRRGAGGTDEGGTPLVPLTKGGGKRRCCVRTFEMPSPAPAYAPGANSVTVTFGVHATFIPNQESAECDCTCCEYRQWITYAHYRVTGGPGGFNQPKYGPREDCVCGGTNIGDLLDDTDDKYFQERCDPASPPPGTAWIHCAGEKGIALPPGFLPPAIPSKYSQDGCEFRLTDRMERPAPAGGTVDWSMVIAGIIWDVCYEVERSWREFGFDLKGVFDPYGQPPQNPTLTPEKLR